MIYAGERIANPQLETAGLQIRRNKYVIQASCRLAASRQMITFFLKYISRNSVGEQFFLRLKMRLKLDRLLKPQS